MTRHFWGWLHGGEPWPTPRRLGRSNFAVLFWVEVICRKQNLGELQRSQYNPCEFLPWLHFLTDWNLTERANWIFLLRNEHLLRSQRLKLSTKFGLKNSQQKLGKKRVHHLPNLWKNSLPLAWRLWNRWSAKDALASAFKKFDINGDGRISEDELKRVMMVLDPSLNPGELELIFAGADLSKVRNEGREPWESFQKNYWKGKAKGIEKKRFVLDPKIRISFRFFGDKTYGDKNTVWFFTGDLYLSRKTRKVFGNQNQFPGRPADFCSKNTLQLSKIAGWSG